MIFSFVTRLFPIGSLQRYVARIIGQIIGILSAILVMWAILWLVSWPLHRFAYRFLLERHSDSFWSCNLCLELGYAECGGLISLGAIIILFVAVGLASTLCFAGGFLYILYCIGVELVNYFRNDYALWVKKEASIKDAEEAGIKKRQC